MILYALYPHEEGYGPSLTKVTIEACQINFVCSTPHFESLSLIDIPDGQDLRWILNHCDVIATLTLCIKDCVNFSARVLRKMYDSCRELDATEPPLDPWGRDFHHYLRQLSIAGDRPEFSQDDQAWLDKLNSSTEPTSRQVLL
ncbi:hypothetical protein BDN67DRAFT_976695, partial [Paxillus ammoniavirescens]